MHVGYPPEVQKSIKQEFDKNCKQVITNYALYVSALCDCIKGRNVKVDDLVTFLLNLPALNYEQTQGDLLPDKKDLLSDKKEKLLRAGTGTINDVFNTISVQCSSFLDYGIFKAIVTKYDVKLEEHKDLNYSEHLRKFINKHKLSELAKVIQEIVPRENDVTKLDMTFMLDLEMANEIAKVWDLKISIADALDLDQSALELKDITEGSVIVTFLIPRIVTDVIFTKSLYDRQIERLKALPIIWVKYQGRKYILKCSSGEL